MEQIFTGNQQVLLDSEAIKKGKEVVGRCTSCYQQHIALLLLLQTERTDRHEGGVYNTSSGLGTDDRQIVAYRRCTRHPTRTPSATAPQRLTLPTESARDPTQAAVPSIRPLESPPAGTSSSRTFSEDLVHRTLLRL